MNEHVRSMPRPAASRTGTQGKRRWLTGFRSSGKIFTRRRLIGGLGCLFAGAIIVNAVVLQNEKHPSPLFRTVAKAPEAKAQEPFPLPPQRPEARAASALAPVQTAARATPAEKARVPEKPATPEASDALVTEIQRELGKRGYFKGDINGKTGAATTQAIRDFQFAQRMPVDGRPSEPLLLGIQAAKVSMKEELSDLLKKTAGGEEKSVKTVSDVQKALNRVGYGPLSEDGQLGPSTKQALAKFEADKKLPPRGEPKGPVLKLLASASGVQISQ
jgi:peptidoglycan hydrolase-like protein with peptidoglycan-binding domain